MTMGVKDLGDEYELGMRQPMQGREKNEKQVKVEVWIISTQTCPVQQRVEVGSRELVVNRHKT